MHLIQKINPAKPDQSSLPASALNQMKSAGLAEARYKFAQNAEQSRYYVLKKLRNLMYFSSLLCFMRYRVLSAIFDICLQNTHGYLFVR